MLKKVINPIFYAECSIGFLRIEEIKALFEHSRLIIKPLPQYVLVTRDKGRFSTYYPSAKLIMSLSGQINRNMMFTLFLSRPYR